MRILHTADWHLGLELHKLNLWEDQRLMLRQIQHIVNEQKIDVIVISGDIYDTALATKEAIQLFDEMMTILCKDMQKQVIVIAGNHDGAQRLASMNQLLSFMGLHIYGKLEQVIEPLVIDDIAFYPMPFFHLETFRQVYDCQIKSYEEAFAIVNKQAKRDIGYHRKILLAHTFCANAAVCESDRFANIGGSDLVSASVMNGFDYVALGHLHRKQRITERICYSGSPLAYSFSEAVYDKYVLIYDTVCDQVEEIMLIPEHPLLTLTGTFEELQSAMQQGIQEDAYIKIELTNQSVTFEMMQYFKEHIPSLLQLTGKSAVMDQSISIQAEEMDQMSDLDIVKQFFKDYYQLELDEEQIALFQQASQIKEELYAA